MPSISASSSARILERAELEPLFTQAKLLTIAHQLCAIRRDEVRETLSLPYMMVQPQATIHCVDHSLAAALKLTNVELVAEFRHVRPAHAGPCAIGR